MRARFGRVGLLLVAVHVALLAVAGRGAEGVRVGFAERDITPELREGRQVWLAGYGHGRAATAVHDPLMARTVVLADGQHKIALVSIDCVGLQLPEVDAIRSQLPDFDYVLVSSTHDHEAPDVIGIWGRTPLSRGVDDQYLERLIQRTVDSVRAAEQQLTAARADFGYAEDESLVRDSRLPEVKDGVLRALRFTSPDGQRPLGLLVQWNSHPEAMGSRNTQITADFPWATVAWLQEKYRCPVVYMTGTVGGLMAPPRDRIRSAAGELLKEGDFEYTRQYGEEVARLADAALADARPIELTPLGSASVRLALPVENPLYRTARTLGVLTRKGVVWTGDAGDLSQPLRLDNPAQKMAIETEVACLRLGALHIAAIPGEIYPELVYGRYQEPAEPNVDYPDAPLEPSVSQILPGDSWMLLGLANDEVGYILPKRQWDLEPPYAYGRTQPQYGEVNSCGPETGPLLMAALQQAVRKLSEP